jgi:hypothetical protein
MRRDFMTSATDLRAAVLSSKQRAWLVEMGALLGVVVSAAPGAQADEVETNGVEVDGAKTDEPKVEGAKTDRPKASGAKVAFKVTDKESGAPLGKASVRVGKRTSQTDDANGACQIEIDADGSNFLVQKDGFQDVTGNVDAQAGEQAVQLEKEPAFNPPPESKQPTLRKGANSADGWVEYLQKLLNKIFGPGTVPEDGVFDQKVEDVVKRFQGSTDPPCLKDGVVGNETWSMLRKGKREAVGVNKKGEETGAEGRWATEKNDFVTYDPGSDELRMVVVSVGEEPLDKFKATFRITSQDQKVKKQFLRELGAPDVVSPTGSGHLHSVKVQQMSVIYGNGEHLIESFLDEELGGDLWTGTVKVAGAGPGPVPTTKTGKLTVLVLSSDDDSPVPNASITVSPAPAPPASELELTGDDGKANLQGLAVGPCTITAKADDAVGSVDVQILENETTSVSLSIARTAPDPNKLDVPKKPTKPDKKPRKVFIKAIDEAGKEIPNVKLDVSGQRQNSDPADEEMLELTANTNDKGTAAFFLPPRSYRIQGTAAGFDKVSGSFPITGKPDKPLELKMKKSEVPVTSIELTVAPPGASETIKPLELTAKVSLRDKTKTPVGDVLFEMKGLGPPLGRQKLLKNTATVKVASPPKGKQSFSATFKPTPARPGIEECKASIEHRVFDRIKELEFLEFRKRLEPKVGDCIVSARNFESLKTERLAVTKGFSEILKLANASEFEKALESARQLEPDVDSYLVKAAKENEKFVKAGETFDKRLEGAKDKAAEAMKIAKELKKDADTLEHLPLAPRNRLLAALQKPPFSDEKKKAAKVLMSVEYMDPGFERRNQENVLKLARELKGDKEFKEARESWQQDSFTTEKRLKILQKAVDAYAVAFDIKRFAPEPNKYKAPRVVPMQKSLPYPDKTTTLGQYDHTNKELEMNVHDTALKQQPFEEPLDTVIHEMAHHQQSMMSDRLKKPPKMSESDPDFLQAQSFKLNDTSGGFYVHPLEPPPSADKGDEYFTQPDENHSRVTAALIAGVGIGK